MHIPVASLAQAVPSTLMGWRKHRFTVMPRQVISHSDVSPTLCNLPSLSGCRRKHRAKGFLKLQEVVNLTNVGRRPGLAHTGCILKNVAFF